MDKFGNTPIPVRELDYELVQLLDPQGRGLYLAVKLEGLAGTRMAGFVLTRQAPLGHWGAATYALQRTDTGEDHRDHRGHRAEGRPLLSSDAPYAPYGDGGSTYPCHQKNER